MDNETKLKVEEKYCRNAENRIRSGDSSQRIRFWD